MKKNKKAHKKHQNSANEEEKRDSRVQESVTVVSGILPLSEEELKPLCIYSLHLLKGIDLVASDIGGLSDPYCEISVGEIKRTSAVRSNTLNPIWDQRFLFYSDHPEKIAFKVFDKDRLGSDDPLGEAVLETDSYFQEEEATSNGVMYEGTLKLSKVARGSIQIKVLFRKLSPLRTERLLHQAQQNLKLLSSNSPDQSIHTELLNKIDSQTKVIEDLSAQLKGEQVEVMSHLKKIAILEEELLRVKSDKKLLEDLLANQNISPPVPAFAGESFSVESTAVMQGLAIEQNSPFCVVCGHQCTIM